MIKTRLKTLAETLREDGLDKLWEWMKTIAVMLAVLVLIVAVFGGGVMMVEATFEYIKETI